MNWALQTIIWQAVLTVIPSLVIIGIFKALDKKRKNDSYERED